MNRLIKFLALLFVIGFILLLSCEKVETNSVASYGKLEIIHGNNQTGYFGELLPDSIVLKASSNSIHRKYLIKYELIRGNGNIERGNNTYGKNILIDSTGKSELHWRLGCDYNDQKIKLVLYVDSTNSEFGYVNYYNTPSDSVTITASGTKPAGWGRSCGCGATDFYYSKIISYDESTLYLINHGLFKSTDKGINWKKVEGSPDYVIDGQFNSSGWLYLVTENDGVCYSKDLQNWVFINNGILDHRTPTTFLVEDSTIFVSFYFDGPYKTSNNGGFWRKMLVGGGSQRYYKIARHPNGDIYLFDDWGTLLISKNYGKTWAKVSIEYKYVHSPIYDLKINKDGLIYIGADNATISEVDAASYKGVIHSYYEWNSSSQEVVNITFKHDDVFYVVRGNPRPGIYSKLNNWSLIDIGFSKRIYNYYLQSDNTFLIISDALYYYNQ